MSKHLIPIDEILFVFKTWTLMVQSGFISLLEPGDEVFLFNGNKNKIGKARLNRILPSRNPEITPIEIILIDIPNDLKEVKFIQKID